MSEPLPRALAVLRRGMKSGLHIGAQLYVSLRGQVVADIAIGDAQIGTPMRTDSINLWLSSTKPIAAVAVGQLWEKGLLDWDDPVATHISEFGVNDKDAITIKHLLTHTAGFRALVGKWEDHPWDAVIASVCAARLESAWTPGKNAGYHVATSWYILGELIRRLDGRTFDQYVREMIFTPLGMDDSWIGLPPERFDAYTRTGRFVAMHDTTRFPPDPSNPLNSRQTASQCRPGSNGRGPIRELGTFYEMLLNGGRSILKPATVEMLIATHRAGMFDQTFKHIVDWGLGFVKNSKAQRGGDAPYGFGPHASMDAFGHSGSQSSTAFADPQHGLVVAWVCNGMPGEKPHDKRLREIDGAIYEDLGLA